MMNLHEAVRVVTEDISSRLERVVEALRLIKVVTSEPVVERDDWLTPAQMWEGKSGTFIASDVRNWLALAERADVPSVPAHPVLELSYAETNQVLQHLQDVVDGRFGAPAVENRRVWQVPSGTTLTMLSSSYLERQLMERAAMAMEEVPKGWMIRHACASGIYVPEFACVRNPDNPRLLDPPVPDYQSVGYLCAGGSRIIDVYDPYMAAFGLGTALAQMEPLTFVARPWVEPARWRREYDAEKGDVRWWPAEWKVYIQGTRVIGVRSARMLVNEPNRDDARMALQALEYGQRIVGQMAVQRVRPSQVRKLRPEQMRGLPRVESGDLPCVLKFIETPAGLALLDGQNYVNVADYTGRDPRHLPQGISFSGGHMNLPIDKALRLGGLDCLCE